MTRDYAYYAENNCGAPSSMGVFSTIYYAGLLGFIVFQYILLKVNNATVDLAPPRPGKRR